MTLRYHMRTAALGLALAGLLSGCALPGFHGVQDIPLPGGADLGSHPYTVKATFATAVSLIPQSAVKVNDVAVGRVSKITLGPDGWSAVVTMKVNGEVRLPANAYASLEQSSLLGEKYVQLSAPPAGTQDAKQAAAVGPLRDGAVIPVSRTNRSAEVEEVFGALSMVLNGGGVSQLKTITTELNKALGGNEPQIRDLLSRIGTLVSDLNAQKGDITDALDGVNQLASNLATRDRQIGTVLTSLSPGLKALDAQRGQLLTMLRSLNSLSTVAVDTVNRSKADMVADLTALAPTLRRLADAGKALPDSLQVLATYPFTDEVLHGVKGDYLNVYLDLTAAPGTQIIPPKQPRATGASQDRSAVPLPLPSATTTTDASGGTP